MLMIDHAGTGPGLLARAGAHVRSWSLDSELAAGRNPDISRALRARVELLTSRRHRDSLADSIEGVIAAASGRPSRVRVAPAREPVLANAPGLRALAGLLRADAPMEPRELASLTCALTDGSGPVFAGGDESVLRDLVARASRPARSS